MEFWKRYWTILRPFKKHLWRAMIWIFIGTFMGLAAPYAQKLLFDLINTWAMPHKGGQSAVIDWLLNLLPQTHTLWWATAVILALMLVIELGGSAVGFAREWMWFRLYLLMNEQMPVVVMSHLLKLHIGHHVRENTSKSITKIDRGVNGSGELASRVFGSILPQLMVLPVYIVVLFVLDTRVGILSLAFAIVRMWWTWHDHQSLASHRKRTETLYQESSTVSYEALANIATVQTFGRELYECGRIKSAHKNILEIELVQWWRTIIGGFARDGLAKISAVLVIVIGLWGLEHNELTLGTMVMMLQLNSRLGESVRHVTHEYVDIGRYRESLVHLMDLLDKQPEVISLPTAMRVQDIHGHIRFDRVSFAYNGDGDALHEVSFSVEPGQMLAIVGPSGSGKSTIVSLLLRAYDPRDGAILIDERDLRVLDLVDYRALLGIVPQQVEIFSASVRDNIAYGRPDATQDEIIAAATLAGAHEFILAKPDRYNTIVGERGLDLSGGERQRIGIARAILRNPRLLIFDEATASLDVLSERRIQEALETLRQGRTTIVIAHRFSTIARADSIVVISDGRVVAQGTREQLRNGNPLFAQLEQLQAMDHIRA